MKSDQVITWLEETGTVKKREDMIRYGIPNDNAFGISMGDMKKFAKSIGTDHSLAIKLWESGWYEARTIAVFVADPTKLTAKQMDQWAGQFDNWAICDTACFHLFDRTPHAWKKIPLWNAYEEEFVRRAAYALAWALSSHDKVASNSQFVEVLSLMEKALPDDRPLVNKAMNMALRAIGKRNKILNRAAIETARRLSQSGEKSRAWIGSHAERELASAKVQEKLRR